MRNAITHHNLACTWRPSKCVLLLYFGLILLTKELACSPVPRTLPLFQCCTQKRGRAWYLRSHAWRQALHTFKQNIAHKTKLPFWTLNLYQSYSIPTRLWTKRIVLHLTISIWLYLSMTITLQISMTFAAPHSLVGLSTVSLRSMSHTWL
jgi:hypothetical protein